MNSLGILLDEHIPHLIKVLLQKADPELRVYLVGDGVAPPKSTPDEALLIWIEANNCILLTNNRKTMPVHLPAHLAQHKHVPGIVQMPRLFNAEAVVDDLLLIVGARLSGEFDDQIVYLPLG